MLDHPYSWEGSGGREPPPSTLANRMPNSNHSTKLLIFIILFIEKKDQIKGCNTARAIPPTLFPSSPLRNRNCKETKHLLCCILRGGASEENLIQLDSTSHVATPRKVRNNVHTKKRKRKRKGSKPQSSPSPPLKRVKVKKERTIRRKRSVISRNGNSTISHAALSDRIEVLQNGDSVVLHQEQRQESSDSVEMKEESGSRNETIILTQSFNQTRHFQTNRDNQPSSHYQNLSVPSNDQPTPLKSKRTKKNNKSKTKTTKSTLQRSNAIGGGKSGECLRRIQREWKNAVQLGIAYDWTHMQPISPPQNRRRPNKSTQQPHSYVCLGPMGKNLLRWHFTILGPPSSPYQNGIYHGRILLPKDYPASPPRIQMLTPTGRFVPGMDICLSASAYHPESWSPRWTVVSLVDALRLHMLTTANEIGGLEASSEVRRRMAVESRFWGMGRVNHERMVRAGLFGGGAGKEEETEEGDHGLKHPTHDQVIPSTTLNSNNTTREEEDVSPVATKRAATSKSLVKNQQGGTIDNRDVRKQSLIVCIMKGIYELLMNPTRLGILVLCAFFFAVHLK